MQRLGALLFCLLAVAAMAAAQISVSSTITNTSTANTITKDPQAIALAAKTLAAMGGVQAIATITDSRASGSFTIAADAGSPYPITLETQGTQKARTTLVRSSGNVVRILNGGVAAVIHADGSVRTLDANNTMAQRVDHIPLLSLISEYQNGNIELTQGPTPNSFAVTMIPQTALADYYRGLTKTIFTVDANSGLITSMQLTAHGEASMTDTYQVQILFANYQAVNGVMVPFHQTTYEDGTMTSDLVLNSIAFNVGVPDSDFALPAEVAN
jgi:hypothetical protein